MHVYLTIKDMISDHDKLCVPEHNFFMHGWYGTQNQK